jgi:hypothetical protein
MFGVCSIALNTIGMERMANCGGGESNQVWVRLLNDMRTAQRHLVDIPDRPLVSTSVASGVIPK